MIIFESNSSKRAEVENMQTNCLKYETRLTRLSAREKLICEHGETVG